jgi:predicted nucleic acid-binding protein
VILYLDTSSLVKIYLEESHSDLVREWVDAAEMIATSRVAFPEALSAFARRKKQGDLDPQAFDLVRETLESDWPKLILLPLKERRAGDLVVKHLLRGFDAVHLAAALELRELLQSEGVVLSSFDNNLLGAARAEGIPLLVPSAEDLR